MRFPIIAVLVAVALCFCATPAFAQTVKNPTTAVFTVSPDHAQVTRYEIGFFIGTAVDPVQVADLGTGTPVAGELSKPVPSYPIGQTYVAKVKAYAGTIASDWSAASNPFYRTPATPGPVVIR